MNIQKINQINHYTKLSKTPKQPTNSPCLMMNRTVMPSFSSNKYLINFKGLTEQLSEKPYRISSDVFCEMENNPKDKGIVGNIPKSWASKIPENKRKASADRLLMSFNKAVKNYRKTGNTPALEQSLNKALLNAGIINEEDKLELVFLNEGKRGKAFFIKGISDDNTNENCVIKIFNNNHIAREYYHGNFIEPNRAAYWKRYAGDNTQRGKFFLADMKAGYLVTKFIDNSTNPPEKYFPEKLLGLEMFKYEGYDETRNIVNGYNVDYGGLYVSNRQLAGNETAIKTNIKIYETPEEQRLEQWNRLLKADTDKPKDVRIGLTAALEYLPPENVLECYEKLVEIDGDDVNIALPKALALELLA